jgi:hypothetical protein
MDNQGKRTALSTRRRASYGAVLALALMVLLWSAVWVPVRERPRFPADFDNYHRAARALVAGESPYSVHNFDYPPLLALVVAPLADLTLPEARWAWLWLSQIALVAAAAGVWRWLRDDRRLGPLPAVTVVAGCFALLGTITENLVLGQVHALMLALLGWALASWRRRPAGAAALVGVAAALKLWPALLLAPLLAARRWRALAAGVATTLGLVAGPLLLFTVLLPPPTLPASSGFWMGTPAPLNLTLPALAVRMRDWIGDWPAPDEPFPWSWRYGHNPEVFTLEPAAAVISVGLSATLLAAGLALVLLRLRRSPASARGGHRVPSPGDELRAVTAIVPLVLAAAPLAWYHYQLFLVLPLAAVAADAVAPPGPVPARKRGLSFLAVPALAVGATYSHRLLGLYHDSYGSTAARPLLFLGLTALAPLTSLVFFVWLLRGIGSAEASLAKRSASP